MTTAKECAAKVVTELAERGADFLREVEAEDLIATALLSFRAEAVEEAAKLLDEQAEKLEQRRPLEDLRAVVKENLRETSARLLRLGASAIRQIAPPPPKEG